MADAFLGDFYWTSEGNLDMDHPLKTPLFTVVVCFDQKLKKKDILLQNIQGV